MPDSQTPASPSSDTPAAQTPAGQTPARPKKKRRWLKVLGGLVVLLILLVVFLPTILSLGPVRSFILSQVAGYLNGKVEVRSWSLGWVSPIQIEGVKVFDEQNILVLEADKIETQATLLGLARQNFNLGKTVVSANATKIVVYPDGTTNLHKLVKVSPASTPSKPEPAPAPAPGGGAIALPDVKIDLELNLRAAVELVDERGKTISTLQLRQGSGGTVKIDDLNTGIKPDLKLIYDVDGRPASTVSVAGHVDAVENNKLDLPNLAAELKLVLAKVDIGAAKPFLAMAGLKDTEIDGIANGEINADLQPGQAGGAKGELQIATARFAMPALPDVYNAQLIRVPIDVSRVVEGGASRLKINIQAIAPEVTAAITGDLPEEGLQKLIDTKMPGADGNLSISITAQPAKVAQSFPNTLKLVDGVQVNGGDVYAKIDLWLKTQPKDAIVYSVVTNLSASGVREGKPIAIAPIQFTAAGSLYEIPDPFDPLRGLRDLSIKLTSDFASFTGAGVSVTDVQGSGNADLDKLRTQLAQFADLKDIALAGKAEFSVKNKIKDEATSAYGLDLGSTLTGIKLRLPGIAPIDLQYVKTGVAAEYVLQADPSAPVKEIRSAVATLLVGSSADKPLIDGAVTLASIDPTALTIKQFDVQRGTVTDLKELQRMIDPFVPALREQKIDLQSGAVYLVTRGSADLKAMSFVLENLEVSMPGLRVARDGKELLNEKKVAITTAGTIAAGEQLVVNLSKFTLDSAIAAIKKSDEPLNVKLAKGDAMPRGSGALEVNVNFVPLNRIVRAFAPEQTSTVTAGTLVGELTISGQEKQSGVAFAGSIDGLQIDQTPIEKTAITLNAVTSDALDRVGVSASVKGFATVTVKDTTVNLAAGTPLLKMVEKAVLQIGVPDANKAVTIATSLVPGLKLPYAPGGGYSIVATVAGGAADLEIKGSRASLHDSVNQKTFNFDPKKPISIVARIEAAGTDTINAITVSKLDADVDVAVLKMTDPIVVQDPLGKPVPKGQIEVSGSFDRVMPLLQFLQNAPEPMPYRGLFVFKNTLSAKDGTIAAIIDGNVRDFSIIDPAQRKAVFTEKDIKITGDLTANLDTQVAQIRALNVDMVSSQAAKVIVTGTIEKFLTQTIGLNQVVAKIDADGEKAWPIVFPLLPPDQQETLKTAKITGPIKFDVTANGTYLLGKPTNEAVKPLVAVGQVTLSAADLYESYGLDIRNLTQWFTLEKGLLVTGHRNDKGKFAFAPAFDINSGKGDFGSVAINIGHPDMLVSIGRKQKLLTGVQLNSVMAAQLGSLASVMFKDSKKASGLVDVIVMDCTNVPLADLVAGSKKAKAHIVYNVKDLRLDGTVPATLSGILGWGEQGIVGNINNGSLILADGVAQQDMTLSLVKTVKQEDRRTGKTEMVETLQDITLKGGINLERQRFQDYNLSIAPGLLPERWRSAFSKGATVKLQGNVADVQGILTQVFGNLVIRGEGTNLLEDLLNKNKDKDRKERRD